MDSDTLIWNALYTIGSAFPEGASMLSQERLKGYYAFFKSLEYILPTPRMRRYWTEVTNREGRPEYLSWKKFRVEIRSNKDLLKWLFHVHDAMQAIAGRKPLTEHKTRLDNLTSLNPKIWGSTDMGNKMTASMLNTHLGNMFKNLSQKKNAVSNADYFIKRLEGPDKHILDEYITNKYKEFPQKSNADKNRMRKVYIPEVAQEYEKKATQKMLNKNQLFMKKNAKARKDIMDVFLSDPRVTLNNPSNLHPPRNSINDGFFAQRLRGPDKHILDEKIKNRYGFNEMDNKDIVRNIAIQEIAPEYRKEWVNIMTSKFPKFLSYPANVQKKLIEKFLTQTSKRKRTPMHDADRATIVNKLMQNKKVMDKMLVDFNLINYKTLQTGVQQNTRKQYAPQLAKLLWEIAEETLMKETNNFLSKPEVVRRAMIRKRVENETGWSLTNYAKKFIAALGYRR